MDIRHIIDGYAVSPQIAPGDAPEIRSAGFTTVICNRPDTEVSGDETADAIRDACTAEGLSFVVNPVTTGAMSEDNIASQREAIAAASGPVLAYCRSGTRSAVVWAFGAAEKRSPDEIMQNAFEAGYDLTPFRSHLVDRHGS